jgi:hypothetical protein
LFGDDPAPVGHRRLATFVVAAALVAGVLSVSAGASDTQGRPPGSPDLAAMSLGLGDFPTGARLVRQRYYRDPDFVASYEREFSLAGTRVGRSSLFFVFTGLDVEQTAQEATATFAAAKALFKSKRFRDAFAKEIAREADLTAKSVVIGRPRAPRIGDGAVVLGITLKAQGLPFRMTVTLMRVDRVLGSIVLVGLPGKKVFAADNDRLARTSTDRMRAGLVPTVSGPPLVTGVLNPGQTLSVAQGTWTGDQVTFSYQWERCIEAETGCAPIPGATASTHALTTGDLASTVRVSVTGRNRLGTATASSANTGFVAGPPGAPVATAGPVFDVVVGPGATLTGTTGTWTGSPSSFAYQWRRCSPTTSACVDVVGATGETYTLSVADSGSLIRLLVVATNASGSGGALSPPSAPAP